MHFACTVRFLCSDMTAPPGYIAWQLSGCTMNGLFNDGSRRLKKIDSLIKVPTDQTHKLARYEQMLLFFINWCTLLSVTACILGLLYYKCNINHTANKSIFNIDLFQCWNLNTMIYILLIKYMKVPMLRLHLKLTELHPRSVNLISCLMCITASAWLSFMTTFCVIRAHVMFNFNYEKNLKKNQWFLTVKFS